MSTMSDFQAAQRAHDAAVQSYEALLNTPLALPVLAGDAKRAAARVTQAYLHLVDCREANDAAMMAQHLARIPKAYRKRNAVWAANAASDPGALHTR